LWWEFEVRMGAAIAGFRAVGWAYTGGGGGGDSENNGDNGEKASAVGFGSNDNAEADRRDWSIGNNSKPTASHMQLHTYTSDSAAWITAPLLVFSALNWCDSCESPALSPSYPTTEELPERHVGCALAARWLHAACPPAARSALSSTLHQPSLQLLCSSSMARLPAPASTHPPAF
jgi:hypothetical protein